MSSDKSEKKHDGISITLSIQDAVRIMELVQNGNFPIDAMKDGRYAAFERFKLDVWKQIENA
jgi:hypothetical protein